MRTTKSHILLNYNPLRKNNSFQSVNSCSKTIRNPHFNYTVLNYVQRRLAEMNVSQTPKQMTITKSSDRHCMNPMSISTATPNKLNTKRVYDAKPKIHLEEDKSKRTDLFNKYTQRATSRENSEVFILKKENRKLKEEIGVYRSQLNQLERKMNAFIRQDHPPSKRDIFYTKRKDCLKSNDKDHDNTINSLSVSFGEDDQFNDLRSQVKKKEGLGNNLHINKL